MEHFVDLHCHSYYSDGEDSPTELIKKAMAIKLQALALTDHGTVQGIPEFLHASTSIIDAIVGVEISCDQSEAGIKDIHLIGLFIDHTNKKLLSFLQQAQQQRIVHKQAVIRKLQELGFKITFEEAASFGKGEIGRPHIAKVLIDKYPEKFSSVKEVFEQLLGEGKPAEIHSPYSSLRDAIEVVHQAGGIAILAHPGYYSEDVFSPLLTYFIKHKGDGIEGYYFYENQRYKFRQNIDTNAYFQELATRKKLLISGGADYHGSIKTARMGDANVPAAVLESLRLKAKKYRI